MTQHTVLLVLNVKVRQGNASSPSKPNASDFVAQQKVKFDK